MGKRVREYMDRKDLEREEEGLGPISESTTRDTTQALMDYAAEGGDAFEEINAMRVEAGLLPLEEGEGAEWRKAGAEGDPDDWVRALMERQQTRREGMYETGRGDIQDVEDAILTRTELDEAHNLLREQGADLSEQQLSDKGIRGLAERDRLQEFAESRQELSGDTVGRYEDLLDWDRERIGNLARGTDMLVGTDFDDDYLKDIHTALGKVSTESTGIEHTALDKIIAQLEEGKTWEDEDYGEVYTQSEAAQKDIDKARSDRLGFDVTRADEEANRERLTKERLLKDRLGLVERGMQEEGATHRANIAERGAQLRAEQAAKVNMKNMLADPSVYMDLEQIAADAIDATDDEAQQQMLRDALQEIGVSIISSAQENARIGRGGQMTPDTRTYTGTQGVTTPAQAAQVVQVLQGLIDSGDMPPELLRRLAGG